MAPLNIVDLQSEHPLSRWDHPMPLIGKIPLTICNQIVDLLISKKTLTIGGHFLDPMISITPLGHLMAPLVSQVRRMIRQTPLNNKDIIKAWIHRMYHLTSKTPLSLCHFPLSREGQHMASQISPLLSKGKCCVINMAPLNIQDHLVDPLMKKAPLSSPRSRKHLLSLWIYQLVFLTPSLSEVQHVVPLS